MKKRLYKSMLGMVLAMVFCVCCSMTAVHAATYYGSIAELQANVDWWECCTMGTGQQLTVERLEGVSAWECWVMDSSGRTWYDAEDFFYEEKEGTLYIGDNITESGMYYLVVNTYEDGGWVEGCVEITYFKLGEMPEGQAVLVGSGACDYSICHDDDFPYQITYTSSDTDIATVDINGQARPGKKAGDVTITATVEYPNQEPVVYSGVLDVTNPSMQSTVVVARKENLTISIPGTSEYSSWHFGNNSKKTSYSSGKCSVTVYGDEYEQCLQLSITAKNKKTSQKITLTVDGKVLTFRIVFSNPKLNKEVLVVKKGKKLTIPVTGTKNGSVVTCDISDESIAVRAKGGKVKGKKLGTTWLSVDVDGKTFYVLLVVQKGKMYKVVKYAADQIGTAKYSQERRMEKGYYDCSSLVWRSYKAAGLNIGNTTWALNSDGLANYYYKKGKHYVGKKLKTNKKLKCGDIIIRGKYKNGVAQTYHAELYIGDGYVIEAGGYGVHLSTTMGADIAVRPWP